MIVKVQTPLWAMPEIPAEKLEAMVYNEDKTVFGFVPVNDELLKKLQGRTKAYFHAARGDTTKGRIILGDGAPDQDW